MPSTAKDTFSWKRKSPQHSGVLLRIHQFCTMFLYFKVKSDFHIFIFMKCKTYKVLPLVMFFSWFAINLLLILLTSIKESATVMGQSLFISELNLNRLFLRGQWVKRNQRVKRTERGLRRGKRWRDPHRPALSFPPQAALGSLHWSILF